MNPLAELQEQMVWQERILRKMLEKLEEEYGQVEWTPEQESLYFQLRAFIEKLDG